MKENQTTVGKLLDIQAEQLGHWGTVLKPEVFARLCEIVKETTPIYGATQKLAPALQGDYDAIPRGSYIDERVHNFAAGNGWGFVNGKEVAK